MGVCWTEISNETRVDGDGGVNSDSYKKKKEEKDNANERRKRTNERKGGEVERNGPNRWEVVQSAETMLKRCKRGREKGEVSEEETEEDK